MLKAERKSWPELHFPFESGNYICNKASSKCEWIQLVILSFCLKKNIFHADEIAQKLNNPVSPYFMWNGSSFMFCLQAKHHCMHLQCDKEFFWLMCIFFCNLHSQFNIVWLGDVPHQSKRSNSLYLFPQMSLVVYMFAVRSINIFINVWHSVFKWSEK